MALVILKGGGSAKNKWGDTPMFQKQVPPDKKSLKLELHKRMPAYDSGRLTNLLHASDVTSGTFCPQEFVYAREVRGKTKGSFIGTSLRATFDLGRTLQELLNSQWGVDTCIGSWECLFCGKVSTFCKRPPQCPWCKTSTKFKYQEERFEAFGISGSVDYILSAGGKFILVEVKTIKPDAFKKLSTALAEHRLRTTLYLELVANSADGRKDYIDCSYGIVLYICKGFGCKDNFASLNGIKDTAFSPFKEYYIDRNPELVNNIITLAKSTRPSFKGSPIKICQSRSNGIQRKCEFVDVCWG